MRFKEWRFSALRWDLAAVIAAVALTLTGCTISAGDDNGETSSGTFASGSVVGIGSLIVNGVIYDTSRANIADGAGTVIPSAELKLGRVIDIMASVIKTDPSTGNRTAVAETIHCDSDLIGAVTNFDSRTLYLLGQTVWITSTTVFGESLPDRLNSLRIGDVVEVYGFYADSGRYTASRVDLKTNASAHKIRGMVSNLSTVYRRFSIGDAVISYENLPSASIQNNQFTRVELRTSPNSSGNWVATTVNSDSTTASRARNVRTGVSSDVDGYVTRFGSSNDFDVSGITVNARDVSHLPTIALGSRVLVRGYFRDSRIIAETVERLNDQGRTEVFTVDGPITSLDSANKVFTVRNITIDYSGQVIYWNGSASSLRTDINVNVRGPLSTTSGNLIVAREITFN